MGYKVDRDQRTIGKKWHEEAENENPLAAFLTFAIAMLAVIFLLFALPGEAVALEAGTVPSIAKTAELSKAKAKAISKASKAYSKHKKAMTKDQRLEYRKYVWKIDRAKNETRISSILSMLDKYNVRAKLVSKLKEAKGFSLKKAAYVAEWGKRIDKYLTGSNRGQLLH